MKLFDFIERLVTWEATTDEDDHGAGARVDSHRHQWQSAAPARSFRRRRQHPAGGAATLALEAHASDLNPVAVMINKAMIEIPPRFAGMAPVNPRDRAQIGRETWKGAAGLAADLRYYGEWVRETGYDARETGYDARETGRVVLQQG